MHKCLVGIGEKVNKGVEQLRELSRETSVHINKKCLQRYYCHIQKYLAVGFFQS